MLRKEGVQLGAADLLLALQHELQATNFLHKAGAAALSCQGWLQTLLWGAGMGRPCASRQLPVQACGLHCLTVSALQEGLHAAWMLHNLPRISRVLHAGF